MKIKKGDKVKILIGKDKSRVGLVRKVITKRSSVIVEKINLVKKHVKATSKDKPGGIIEVEKPLSVSKLMIICPQCSKTTRVGYQLDKSGKKYRICRKCQSLLDGAKTRAKSKVKSKKK